MILDFHTHIFPAAIAPRTIAALEEKGNMKAATNGMEDGLKASMEKAGIDISVVLPVVTNPKQITTVNKVAYETNERWETTGIMSFGGIHPDNENYIDELKAIKDYGLKGIKLHPDYQGTFFNDIRYKRIIYKASELGLITVVHGGLDVGMPDPIHCTPEYALELIDQVKPDKLVLAHMGGYSLWEQVENLLSEKNVYIDTAFCLTHMPQEVFLSMVKSFGQDKVLFATDSPWADQKEYVEILSQWVEDSKVREDIYYNNGAKLLGLQ